MQKCIYSKTKKISTFRANNSLAMLCLVVLTLGRSNIPTKIQKSNVEDFGPPYADLVANGTVKISSQC